VDDPFAGMNDAEVKNLKKKIKKLNKAEWKKKRMMEENLEKHNELRQEAIFAMALERKPFISFSKDTTQLIKVGDYVKVEKNIITIVYEVVSSCQ
jgi:hypothetical protein